MLKNEFYKIRQDGGSFVTATLFNPVTGETKTVVVRDYDYNDCRNDNDEVYYMPINEEALAVCIHNAGGIVVGDTVEVVKGRKLPIGMTATVKSFRTIYDKYHRFVASYVVLDNGMSTNEANVKRIA